MEDREKLAYMRGIREMLDFVLSMPFGKGGETAFKGKLYDFYFSKDRGDTARLAPIVVPDEVSGKEL